MTTHTPGPWEPHRGVIGGGNSLRVCKPDATKSRGCFSVAEAETIGIPRRQAEANARLIAAAPDLLAACKSALFWGGKPQGSTGSQGLPVETLQELESAIGKAEKEDA